MTNWKALLVSAVLITGLAGQQQANSSQPTIRTIVAPPYPPMARQAQVAGTVRAVLKLGADGGVENVKIVSGHPMLVGHVAEALKRWRFDPSPDPAELAVSVRFCFAGERSRPGSIFASTFVSAELPTQLKVAVSPPPHSGGDLAPYPAVADGDRCEEY